MKKTVLISLLLFSGVAIAQRSELRSAEKAINKAQFAEAENILSQVKSSAVAQKKYAVKYYYLMGKLAAEQIKMKSPTPIKTVDVAALMTQATENFGESLKLNAKEYKSEIQELKQEIINAAIVQGQELYKVKNYKKASPIFEQVFRMSPSDTLFLYNAAITSATGKDYDTALRLYTELKDLKYDGSETTYSATNKETGKVENFATKDERDLMIKSKSHISPKNGKTPSKKAEIIKNIALIHVEQGNKQEAIEAFSQARRLYPKDTDLIIQEAYVHLQMGDKEKFKSLMQEAATLDPTNADLLYNIGVINLQQDHFDEARAAFEKALTIKPDYADAALNISTTYINDGNTLVEQMNKLGNTKADAKKYNELKEQKDRLFQNAASYLENYISKQAPTNDILNQLANIYTALGDYAKAKQIKSRIK